MKNKNCMLKQKLGKFNFVKNLYYSLIVAGVLLLAGLVVLCVCGLNLGLDFTGGTILEVNSGSSIIEDSVYNHQTQIIKNQFDANGLKLSQIQRQGSGSDARIVLRFQDIDGKSESEMSEVVDNLKTDIKTALENDDESLVVEFSASERISASASKTLLWKAFLAITVAIALMLIYIAIRFEFFSGLCALLALLHDVLIMVALTTICRITVNSTFIAAIITIIGYSINNTIVVFDRIREISKKDSYIDQNFEVRVNDAIKQTLSRTINTSITTLIAVVLLACFGVGTMSEFVLPIIFGLIAGTYSSVFLAGPIFAKIADKRHLQFRQKTIKIKNESK